MIAVNTYPSRADSSLENKSRLKRMALFWRCSLASGNGQLVRKPQPQAKSVLIASKLFLPLVRHCRHGVDKGGSQKVQTIINALRCATHRHTRALCELQVAFATSQYPCVIVSCRLVGAEVVIMHVNAVAVVVMPVDMTVAEGGQCIEIVSTLNDSRAHPKQQQQQHQRCC